MISGGSVSADGFKFTFKERVVIVAGKVITGQERNSYVQCLF